MIDIRNVKNNGMTKNGKSQNINIKTKREISRNQNIPPVKKLSASTEVVGNGAGLDSEIISLKFRYRGGG